MNQVETEFAKNETLKTIKKFTSSPNFNKIRTSIVQVLNSEEHISYCEEHYGKMYHLLQNNIYPKGVYRVCDTSHYRAGIPNWKIIFNIADFDSLLNDDVYLEGYLHLTKKPDHILLTLSSQGKDEHYILEFNIPDKKVMSTGFNFPLSKSFVQWRDENSVWISPAWEETQLTTSGYSKQVWLLEREQAFSDAKLIFEGNKTDIFVEAWRYLDAHGSCLDIIKQSHSFYQFSYYVIQPNLQPIHLKLPKSCNVCGYLNGHLFVHLTENWQRNQQNFQVGSILAVRLQKGQLKEIITVFVPQDKQVIEAIETSKDYIFIHYLENVHSRAKVFLFKNKTIQAIDFPDLEAINFELIDQPWRTNIFYIAANDLIHEPTLYAWEADKNSLTVLRKQKPLFNKENLRIQQQVASSKDGTAIPYFWCGSQNTNSPTLIYCYGGFAVNELPHYMPIIGKLWLEQGYSFVISNLRGGAELGEHWHRQATKKNKYKTIQDLRAVIQDLQDKQQTSASLTVIQGASNGGLIVANAMTDFPQLLQAVICEVPIIDMQHYTQYGSGNLWIDEYGDPKNPHMQPHLQNITAINKISDTQKYPKLLVTSNLTDDRVDPKHAILLHQKMLDSSHNSHLICQLAGGHESLNSQDKQAEELAYLWFFLYNALDLNFETDKSDP